MNREYEGSDVTPYRVSDMTSTDKSSEPLITRDADARMGADGEAQTSDKSPAKRSMQVEYGSWLHRTFGPMKPGSIRASIFSLVATALGTGVLALPFLLRLTGLVLGLGFLTLGATLCLISLYMLSYCSFKKQETQYSVLVEKVLGNTAARIMDGLMSFYGFGAAVGYQITISQFFPDIVSGITGHPYTPTNLERFIQVGVVTLALFPISLIKNLYGIRYATYFGVACIFYILIVVVAQTPEYIREEDSLSKITYFDFNIDFFTSFAIASFSFTCHSNLFPVRTELARAKDARLKKVVRRVVGINSFLYFLMAVCGYLSLTDQTPQLIVQRPKLPGVKFDWTMILALCAISFTLFISSIINLVPTRLQILIITKKNENTDNKIHVLLTAGLVFCSGLIAYAIPNIISALGLIGGIGSVSLSITFPFLLYAKVREEDTEDGPAPKALIVLVRILAVMFSILGLIGAAISFGEALDWICGQGKVCN